MKLIILGLKIPRMAHCTAARRRKKWQQERDLISNVQVGTVLNVVTTLVGNGAHQFWLLARSLTYRLQLSALSSHS